MTCTQLVQCFPSLRVQGHSRPTPCSETWIPDGGHQARDQISCNYGLFYKSNSRLRECPGNLHSIAYIHPVLRKSGVNGGWSPAKPRVRPHFPTSTSSVHHRLAEDAPANPSFTALMPARLRSAFSRSLARSVDSAGVFYCPSCATWRRTLSTRANANASVSASSTGVVRSDTLRRTARLLELPLPDASRSFTTSSVITAGKTVPPRFKELYDALSAVQGAALEQVSITRLRLALRGLESDAPLIRIAGE